MLGDLVLVFLGAGVVSCGLMWERFSRGDLAGQWFWGLVTVIIVFCGAVMDAILAVQLGDYSSAVVSFLMIFVSAWIIRNMWRNRGNRKKAGEMLGVKSRALRDKVVRKLREVTVPSPIPVPA